MSTPQLQPYAYVLAVPDLRRAVAYFEGVLGFTRDWNDGDNWQALTRGTVVVEASYSRPFIAHASMAPSCALAKFADGTLTVWTHSQGVFNLRGALSGVRRRGSQNSAGLPCRNGQRVGRTDRGFSG